MLRDMPCIAVVRVPSSRLADGEVTHIERRPLDVARAVDQHTANVALLAAHGCTIRHAPPLEEHPDGVFVEDVVVVVDDLAVLTRPGAASRRGEVASMEPVVRELGLRVATIEGPGTLDGGDVCAVGDTLFVGRTSRTDDHGIARLAELVAPLGRTVVPVAVTGCLHLKTAVTALPDGSVVAVPGWVDPAVFTARGVAVRTASEPSGGDVLSLPDLGAGPRVVLSAAAPRTAAMLDAAGFAVAVVDVDELHRVEAGVTCMSVLVDRPG
jgi:dimethylargininase